MFKARIACVLSLRTQAIFFVEGMQAALFIPDLRCLFPGSCADNVIFI